MAIQNDIFGQPTHAGSWFGLTDLGLTEGISDLLGLSRQQGGGSNVTTGGALNTLGTPTNQPVPNNQFNYAKPKPTPTSNNNGNVLGANTGGNSSNQNPFNNAANAARGEQDALLSSLNTQYDQLASNLQGQLGYLGTQKDNALNSLNQQIDSVRSTVGKSKQNSIDNTDQQIQEAGSVAKSTQLQNRNVLRALGILNSTAAGDLLSKPMTEFDKQRGMLTQALGKRVNELDDFLNQKVAEGTQAVKEIQDNYSQLVGQIQSDLRFNDRQRADAIKSANAALQSNLANIQNSVFNYKAQIDAAKGKISQELEQYVNGYQDPTANIGALNMTSLTAPTSPTQQANVFVPEKKKESGLLSAL